jgi:lysophospholipid acyltransferase (LPLAT)-like uncharacterized protein
MRNLAPPLVAALVNGLGRTLRMTLIGVTPLVPLWQSKRPLIYVVWHGRMLMVPWLNAQLRATHRARAPRMLVSNSRNGELMGRFVSRFGLDVVMRGPSRLDAAVAVDMLVTALDRGDEIALAPDGPRGPHEAFKPGAIALAALTGASIVPVAIAAHPAGRLPSWDHFLIPLPFARCVVVFGEPIGVRRDADRARTRGEMERILSAVTATADRLVRRESSTSGLGLHRIGA